MKISVSRFIRGGKKMTDLKVGARKSEKGKRRKKNEVVQRV